MTSLEHARRIRLFLEYSLDAASDDELSSVLESAEQLVAALEEQEDEDES